MLSLHRQTAEKYFRVAAERGELICLQVVWFVQDRKAVIDFDLQRFHTDRVNLLLSYLQIFGEVQLCAGL